MPGINRFYENDEFDFNDHTFVLKPKKMTSIWIALSSAVASIILLLFIVSFASGNGSDFGITDLTPAVSSLT